MRFEYPHQGFFPLGAPGFQTAFGQISSARRVSLSRKQGFQQSPCRFAHDVSRHIPPCERGIRERSSGADSRHEPALRPEWCESG